MITGEIVNTTTRVTDAMVSRFLGWKLPEDFAPDAGITFNHDPDDFMPTGTNLLTADQARAMLEHVLGVEASGTISSKTAKVDVIFGGEVLARGVSPADPGQGPIDLGEVTGCQQAPSMIGENAPDLRPTEPVEADTLGETKAEQQTAHQLSDSIEAEIVAKGLTAPRITPADVEAVIASEHYFTANDGVQGANYEVFGGGTIQLGKPGPETLDLLTFCVLVLRNGFTVTGESACASPENFDAALGRKIARQNAVAKVWPLLGYSLRERLASGGGL